MAVPDTGVQIWRLDERSLEGLHPAFISCLRELERVLQIYGQKLQIDHPSPFRINDREIYVGSGTPEGNQVADIGSIWLRTDGGASTSLYVKESGTGNTGWVAK